MFPHTTPLTEYYFISRILLTNHAMLLHLFAPPFRSTILLRHITFNIYTYRFIMLSLSTLFHDSKGLLGWLSHVSHKLVDSTAKESLQFAQKLRKQKSHTATYNQCSLSGSDAELLGTVSRNCDNKQIIPLDLASVYSCMLAFCIL